MVLDTSTTNPFLTAMTTASQNNGGNAWRNVFEAWHRAAVQQGIDDGLPHFAEICARIAKNEFGNHQGILLIGGTGCGKTHRMRFIERNMSVTLATAADMVDRITRNDSMSFFEEVTRTGRINCINNKRYNDLIIDELGAEATSSSTYGNRRDIMANILTSRHSAWLSNGWLTHITTNLNEQMLTERYGERLVSRLHEMCVFVVMRGGDRRRGGRL